MGWAKVRCKQRERSQKSNTAQGEWNGNGVIPPASANVVGHISNLKNQFTRLIGSGFKGQD
jgi:hypothetical protein